MGYKIELSKINDILSKTHFANDGDSKERLYWTFFKERFSNCENFWRYFIVPFTKRIDDYQIKIIAGADYTSESEFLNQDPSERIHPREGISQDIQDIGSFHYSMFVNLVYSYDNLRNFRESSFEAFYMHLTSTLDSVEEFLLKVYLLILECTGQKSGILRELKKEDVLKLAQKWYDAKYSKAYENYLRKGKTVLIRIHSRENALDKYFENSEDWKEYKRHAQEIRAYRNTIVHDIQIGRLVTEGADQLVPKKEKIQHYKRWSYVFAASEDILKLKDDFINMTEQMVLDIGKLEIILNKLWDRPINDIRKLFFEDKNKILLKKYDIDLI